MLSQELKEMYSSVGPSVLLETLELTHHAFPSVFRIVRDRVDWDLGLENGGPTVTFTAHAFQIVLPPRNEKGNQSLQIQLDNIDRKVVDLLEATQDGTNTPIEVVYRVYLDTETDEPQSAPLKLSLFNIAVDNTRASGSARRDDVINRKFPGEVYGRKFKSLFNA